MPFSLVDFNGIKKTISHFLKKNKSLFFILIFLTIFGDVFLRKYSSDIIIFSILLIYLFAVSFYKTKSSLSFKYCFIIIVAMAISFIFTETSSTTEKSAVWAYIFLVIGIIQQWFEINSRKSKVK